jgi:hypothetical protein
LLATSPAELPGKCEFKNMAPLIRMLEFPNPQEAPALWAGHRVMSASLFRVGKKRSFGL